ncbi:hypothetical protein Z959_04530 [Clostridium novyi B str. ATCC 27606]|uniref:Uncharacterized protein n=2 Tax=Clostridium TaxID=1485 RepID=A0AA40IS56_CLONO|nr:MULTISPECIES: hypothetical protein [Clostridium]KEI12469.1 hypothetical protein Z959_04530 [Clostridium novyi B str. ATCC 27606]KEI16750.1 hypothetical protein Z960_08385 [Clostridium haemolyticum NCTC 9693]KGN04695.1 hypothetical protein Z961_01475 [Clostridium haemolyticum NCTC 8350]
MIKRKMSVLLAAVVVASGVGMAKPAFAANTGAKQLPAVSYIAPQNTLATDKEPFSFALEAANYEGDVQYRIFIQKDGGKWTELTNGYSEAVNAKIPYIPQVKKNLEAGKYKASVWVKRAEVKEGNNKSKFGSYDTYYVKEFSIKTADAFKGRAELGDLGIKDTYKVGEKLTLKGHKGSQYKLHIYDPSAKTRKEGWIIDKTYETGEATNFTFTKPGKYLVDVWGMSTNPTDAVKAQGYGGWKLKVVTVEEGQQEVKATIEVSDGITAFDRYVKATLNVSDPENYKVTVCGKELKFVANKGFFQGVVAQTDEKEIKANVKIEKIGEKVEVPNFKVEEVSAGVTAFDRYVKVTLDTKTPEKFNVTVCGKELKFVDKKGFFQGVVAQTDEKEIKSNVKVTVK